MPTRITHDITGAVISEEEYEPEVVPVPKKDKIQNAPTDLFGGPTLGEVFNDNTSGN